MAPSVVMAPMARAKPLVSASPSEYRPIVPPPEAVTASVVDAPVRLMPKLPGPVLATEVNEPMFETIPWNVAV